MKKLISNKFLLVLLMLLVLIVLVFFLILPKQKKGTTPPPPSFSSPTTSNEQVTPIPISSKKRALTVLSSSVPNRPIGLYEGFIIEFSQTPSTSDFFYKITPSVPITLTLKGVTISIRPRPSWTINTEYKFIIEKGTKDLYGNLLEKDFAFSFKTVSSGGM